MRWGLIPLICAVAAAADPIVYTLRAPAPATHIAEIEAVVPADGRASIDLMMPVWSPGYYRIEDYASRVRELAAHTEGGGALAVERTAPNKWRIATGGALRIKLSYRLLCDRNSVTTNWIGAGFGVLNGAATFITLDEKTRRAHEVRLELPAAWKRTMTALDRAPGGGPNHFRAPDFETLVDSPILAGEDLGVAEFVVGVKKHYLVSAGNAGQWDRRKAAADLQKVIREARRFWGSLPYPRYTFLIVFRQGGGGLEHRNSTLVTAGAGAGTPRGYWRWLYLAGHEFMHAFIGKRLRPVELGPYDWDRGPRTPSLWIAEGLTNYYTTLMFARSGLYTEDDLLTAISGQIASLQKSPGRLSQSVEQSSNEVWDNSNSGINPGASTVSYYVKGDLLGFLLDARIRKASGGRKSLDDAIRLAYKRYSGERGFTPDEFRETVEEVAGADLRKWFRASISSAGELDYGEALDWFGLRFAEQGKWSLEVREDATPAQRRRFREWSGLPKRR